MRPNEDQRLQFVFVNMKCIVIVVNHTTMNKPLLFTHTAHQANQEIGLWIYSGPQGLRY